MLTRMLMTTVAAFVLAAPVAAQDQAKPETAQQLEQAQQELQQQQQTAPAGRADQPATAAQEQPAEGETAAPAPAMTAEEPAAEDEAEVAEDEEATPPADMQFLTEQEAEQFLADDEVIGKEVVNMNDEEVGTITDLVMDQEQKLVGVVLSVGGFLGIGEKWVAVPVDQIEFPTTDQPARLLAAVTEEQLKNAPDFTTRATIEAQEAAEQAQMQQQQQMQQAPAPTTQPSQ